MRRLLMSLLFLSASLKSSEKLEIELKFKPSSKEIALLKKSLGKCNEVLMKEKYLFGEKIVFSESEQYKTMKQYLRVRSTDTKKTITLKKRSESGVVELETTVGDAEAMYSILKVLGYGETEEQVVYLEKVRKIYTVLFDGVTIEIVFDTFEQPLHMKEMGEFVEVEIKSEGFSHEEGISILKRYLLKYGLKEIDQYPPYIELALNPNNYAHKIKKIVC